MRLVSGYAILRLAGIVENLKSIFNKRKFKKTKYEIKQEIDLKKLIKSL